MEVYIRLAENAAPRRNRLRLASAVRNLTSRHRDAVLVRLQEGLKRFPGLVDDVVLAVEHRNGILCTMPAGLITRVSLEEFTTVANAALAYVERYGLGNE